MSLLPVGIGARSDYEIEKSLRFSAGASASLTRTPSAGDRRTFTISLWFKRGLLGVAQYVITASPESTNQFAIYLPADNTVHIFSYISSVFNLELKTTAVLRDPSAWYHLVLAIDTTQATNTNRAKFYVNGEQVTAFTTATYPAQNHQTIWNSAVQHNIGKILTTGYFDGYQTEIISVEGQALDPSYFGKTDPVTGQWVPKKYTGSYGTNGFYLDFKDGTSLTTLGYDKSGNSNNWTLNNISLTAGVTYDWMDDTPSNNFCVYSQLTRTTFAANSAAPAAGGLNVYQASIAAWGEIIGSIGVSSGKWYWETTASNIYAGSYIMVGICSAPEFSLLNTSNRYVGASASSWGYHAANGYKYNNASAVAYGASYTNNDVIGVALDMDAGTVTFYKNNVSQGVAYTGLSGPIFPALSSISGVAYANFGQRPFAYTPPTGFKALCTKNLPTPQVKNGADYFDVVLDSGANIKTASEALYGNFFEWIKDRANTNNHQLIDSVRGNTAVLQSNSSAAETTYSAPSGNSVGWVWRIAAGFLDVVTYTGNGVAGNTIAHALGAVPAMMIVKERNGVTTWGVYHASLGATKYILLDSTAAGVTNAMWNNTAPTTTVFSLGGTGFGVNDSADTYVAYLFAEVEGFSKFGSYVGNGSADGPFVYCGFKPKYVLLKNATTAGTNWFVLDAERNTYNLVNTRLIPNDSSAEGISSPYSADFTSNGFKIRSADGQVNQNTANIVFAAFAECPFSVATAR